MKFLVTTRFKDSYYALPPAKLQPIMEDAAKYRERLAKEGKIKELYFLGTMKGAVVIYELGSSEELARAAFESPMFPFVDAEVTPLVELDAVKKAQAKK